MLALLVKQKSKREKKKKQGVGNRNCLLLPKRERVLISVAEFSLFAFFDSLCFHLHGRHHFPAVPPTTPPENNPHRSLGINHLKK